MKRTRKPPLQRKPKLRGHSRKRILVVAAVIESGGKILACQRRKHDAFGLKWEFPGGKAKAGESPRQALARELREELGVEAKIGAELYRTCHKYAELGNEIELIFFSVQADKNAMRNLAFEKMRWVNPEDLRKLDFLPADRDFIATVAPASRRHPTKVPGPR